MEKETFTIQDIHEAMEEVEKRHYIILNYLINKNSHSLNDGGMDYEKLTDDIQDFEFYLAEDIY